MNVGLGVLSFPLLLAFSSLATFPLAGPPLPLDPALAAIAPEECLWYASSAGVAAADSSSNNQTEQLFAEPEVQNFISGIKEQLLSAVRRSSGAERPDRVRATEVVVLVEALMSRPLAAFVEDLQIADEGFDMQAGFVLNAGEQRAEIEKAIGNLVEFSLKEGLPIGSVTNDGETWYTMRFSMQTPEIRWGWHGNYFLLAIGDGTSEDIVVRLEGKSPSWLDELRTRQTLERESTLVYFNADGLLKRLQPVLEKEQGWATVEKLGLTSIKSYYGWSGFDEQGCVSFSKLETTGERRGLLSLLPDKQLSDNDLKLIPQDAMVATAVRIDLADTWKNILRLVEEFDPQAVEHIERNLQKAENQLGINLEDDLLGSLDDIWIAYLPNGDLMTSWLGSAFACKVKDAPQLQTAIKALVTDLRAKLPQGERSLKIRESEFEGQTIFTVNMVGSPLPVSPSWCVTDDWLIVGLTPQTVRGLITHDSDQTLADVSEIHAAFGNSTAPTALAYYDTPKLVRSAYPFVQMGAQMLSAQLQREGIDIDTSILPSVDAIVRHLRPGVCTMIVERDGVTFRSKHSLPSGGGMLTLLPLTMGSTLPARTVARRNTELNNMKQIALAFHNYADVNRKFPSNIYDDEGNALLSWRVSLLPYLENQALYEQFHLDEPWDSVHNKPLASRLVQVYTSPEGPAGGKTRFLALAGDETIFPGNQELSFRDVRDGTSNTIMFVKAEASAAVPWSKPEDIEFAPEHPMNNIDKAKGVFMYALTDGSCRLTTKTFDEETMRALATRAGNEVIDRSVIHP